MSTNDNDLHGGGEVLTVMLWMSFRTVAAVVGSSGVYHVHTDEVMDNGTVSSLAASSPIRPVPARVVGKLSWDLGRGAYKCKNIVVEKE